MKLPFKAGDTVIIGFNTGDYGYAEVVATDEKGITYSPKAYGYSKADSDVTWRPWTSVGYIRKEIR